MYLPLIIIVSYTYIIYTYQTPVICNNNSCISVGIIVIIIYVYIHRYIYLFGCSILSTCMYTKLKNIMYIFLELQVKLA